MSESRIAQVVAVDEGLEVSRIDLTSPLPQDFPPHPPELERLSYLRYRRLDGPADSANADAILVGHPGGLCGAHALDQVARNTMHAAATRGRCIEWWSIARRGDAAADHTGIDIARTAGDPDLAFDYYYRGRALDGRRFAGFATHRELRYTAELGIARAVLDQRELLVRELPDPRLRQRKLFLGGHSFGNFVTGAYTAWDFDGVPGYTDCAGVFGLDLLPVSDPYRLRTTPLVRTLARSAAGPHRLAVELLRRGLAPRVFPSFAEVLTFTTILALDALSHPEAESDRLRQLPRTPAWEFTLRLWFARGYREFRSGRPDPRELRFTCRGLLAAWIARGHSPISLFQIGVGDSPNRLLARTTFPAPEWAYRVPGLDRATTFAFGPGPRETPADRNLLQDCPSGGWPVHLDELARVIAGGPPGYADTYFPLRLLADGLFWAGARDGDLASLRHERGARALPRMTVLGDDSNPVLILLHLGLLVPRNTVRAHGYTHFDVVAAHRPPSGEVVSDALAEFIAAYTGRRDPRFIHSTAQARYGQKSRRSLDCLGQSTLWRDRR
ncbi:hypothetical protein HLB23_13925 [Nocardia uniformis]|uniref:Uncharacterized protein n=1 Tax=Nocardia uniformis TaxID=53432 RepID=A0A849C0G6_9NOCA|nr:hypothetical protein [Nocardia uniformis]NNH70946.1 hypothetical protein [Nocardia uniformis]